MGLELYHSDTSIFRFESDFINKTVGTRGLLGAELGTILKTNYF